MPKKPKDITKDASVDEVVFNSPTLNAALEEGSDEDFDVENDAVVEEKQSEKPVKDKKVKVKSYVAEREFSVKRRLVTVMYKKGQAIESENVEFMKGVSAPIVEV
jgi:hypothetical protein